MTIVKKKAKKKNFSIIDNEGLHSRDLSWQATGLWAWFMSKPDDWEVSLEHLCKSKTNGKNSTLSALAELEDFGYLVYQRWRNSTGQFESAYTVFESPEQLSEWKETADPDELSTITKVSRTKKRKQSTAEKPQRNSRSGKPATDNPLRNTHDGTSTVENPPQLNIDKRSTELKSTELPIPPNPPTGGTEESGCEENSASPEEEPGIPSQFSLPEQLNQPIDTKNCQVAGDDQAKGVARCNNVKYQNVQEFVDYVMDVTLPGDPIARVHLQEVKSRGWVLPWRVAKRSSVYGFCNPKLVEFICKERASWKGETWESKISTVCKSINQMEQTSTGWDELLIYLERMTQATEPQPVSAPDLPQKPEKTKTQEQQDMESLFSAPADVFFADVLKHSPLYKQAQNQ